MTLLVNYRGGFAKLSDLGIITRDYSTQPSAASFLLFFSPFLFIFYWGLLLSSFARTAAAIARLRLTNQFLELVYQVLGAK